MSTPLMILMLIAGVLHAQSIDDYVSAADRQPLWGNGTWADMDKIEALGDHATLFDHAFRHMSYDEGRPAFPDCIIHEGRLVIIHTRPYYLLRFTWKDRERLLIVDTTGEGKGGWHVR